MMEKLEKLVVALTALANEATEYLERVNHLEKLVQMRLPLAASDGPESEVETMTPNPVPAAPEEPKKTRKPRALKATPGDTSTPEEKAKNEAEFHGETEEQAIADASADREAEEKASYDRMMEVTKQWVILAKNDTPKDGKTQAMAWLRAEPFKVEKLTDLDHAKRLLWITKVEGAIAAHK